MNTLNYRNAFIGALALHLVMVCFLLMEPHHDNFVLKSEAHSAPTEMSMAMNRPEEQAIKAVSVDSQAVAETVNRLKTERAQKERAELNHQRAVEEQLRQAQQQRLKEQQNLAQMKKEAAALALAQQKKLAAEKQHLKELAEQNSQQEQHLAALKQQQIQLKKEQEQQKLAIIQKQKADELARAQHEKAEAALREKNRLAAQAAANAQKAALMSGEVNKYKALIIQAISQHWILPDHVDNQLFSQFKIRLAPNGAVLAVSLIRSSGDPILDRSAQAAIYKASPLPVPTEQAMFDLFRDISLTVRPQSVRG